MENIQHIRRNRCHTLAVEAGHVWLRHDLREGRCTLSGLDHLRLADLGHVVAEPLLIDNLGITRAHDELTTVDVREFRTVAVLTADDLLLTLVVVGRREQMAEDEFRYHDLVLGMGRNGNTVAVIINTELRRRHRDYNLTNTALLLCDSRLADHVVQCVDNEFIEDLEETRIEINFTPLHARSCIRPDPALFAMGVTAADIGVREL